MPMCDCDCHKEGQPASCSKCPCEPDIVMIPGLPTIIASDEELVEWIKGGKIYHPFVPQVITSVDVGPREAGEEARRAVTRALSKDTGVSMSGSVKERCACGCHTGGLEEGLSCECPCPTTCPVCATRCIRTPYGWNDSVSSAPFVPFQFRICVKCSRSVCVHCLEGEVCKSCLTAKTATPEPTCDCDCHDDAPEEKQEDGAPAFKFKNCHCGCPSTGDSPKIVAGGLPLDSEVGQIFRKHDPAEGEVQFLPNPDWDKGRESVIFRVMDNAEEEKSADDLMERYKGWATGDVKAKQEVLANDIQAGLGRLRSFVEHLDHLVLEFRVLNRLSASRRKGDG